MGMRVEKEAPLLKSEAFSSRGIGDASAGSNQSCLVARQGKAEIGSARRHDLAIGLDGDAESLGVRPEVSGHFPPAAAIGVQAAVSGVDGHVLEDADTDTGRG